MDALVGDGLFRLVLVRGLGGEGGNHKDQAVLHILKGDFALVLIVLVVLFEVGVNLIHKGVAHSLVRGAAVLQPTGVVIVLRHMDPVGEGRRHIDLHIVQRHVRPVPDLFLALPELHRGQGILTAKLLGVILNAVFIAKIRGLKLAGSDLIFQMEGHSSVDHCLTLQGVQVVLQRDIDIRKHLEIRLPLDEGAGVLFAIGLLTQAAHILAVLKVKGVTVPIPADIHVHIFRCILGGAQAQAVKAQGVLVVFAGAVVVLASGVHLTEHQLPVVALLFRIVIHRDSPRVILHLHRVVQKPRNGDLLAKALACLVNGVGENLKNGVLAAVDAVGAENHPWPQPHPIRTLQAFDAVVAVGLFFCHVSS